MESWNCGHASDELAMVTGTDPHGFVDSCSSPEDPPHGNVAVKGEGIDKLKVVGDVGVVELDGDVWRRVASCGGAGKEGRLVLVEGEVDVKRFVAGENRRGEVGRGKVGKG